jgi:APA family basic amino acid/polyamine antiporter
MNQPAKLLSPFAATCMVVANMIGVGVFTSVGFQLPGLPSAMPILTLWALGGLLSLCGALCYAEIVAMSPRSGGEYHLLREAYHPIAGFLAGWISLVAGFAAPIALAASAFAKYAQAFGVNAESHVLAAALVIAVAAVNLTDDKILGRFLSGFTIVKVLLILAFIAGAIFLPGGVHNSLAPHTGDGALFVSPAFAISLVYVMYAYEGWNGAAYVAGEVEDPRKNMPRALVIGTVIVTLLYVAVHAVFLWRAPWAAMEGKPEAALIAAQSIFGETGGKFMGFLIAFGLISTVASMICAGSRVNERMGEDVPFLKLLAYQNKAGTPVVAVLLVTAMSLVMLFTKTFEEVLRYVECLLLLSSCLAVLSVIWLRIRKPDAPRPFRVPLFPITPLLFASMTGYMMWFMGHQHLNELVYGLVTLGAGLVVYVAGTLWQKLQS